MTTRRSAFNARNLQRLRPTHILAAGVIGFLSVTGCGTDDGRIEVHPVNGKVLVDGQPAAGARVVFHTRSSELKGLGMPVPAATTDDTGEFRLQSFEGEDGAPAGEYDVSIIWPAPLPPGVREDDEMFRPQDRLQGRYSNPRQSGLTATVERGGGELPPFELD